MSSATRLTEAVELGHSLDSMRRRMAADFERWLDENERRLRRLPDPPDEPEEATVELSWPDISRPTIGYEQPQQGGYQQGMGPPYADLPPDAGGRATPPDYPPLDLSPPPRQVPAWPFVVIGVLVGLIVLAAVVLWLV